MKSQQIDIISNENKRFIPDFPLKLKGIDFETLEKDENSIYGLSKEMKFIYFNPGFIQFSRSNDIEGNLINNLPLGIPVSKILAGEKISEFYIQNFKRIIATGEIWHHEYECSSADEFRIYRQTTYPLKDGEILIIINKLIVVQPIESTGRETNDADPKRYVQSSGFITQCGNCRHIQRTDQSEIWDWVPAWAEKIPEGTSHSICPICFDYYWKYGRIKFTPNSSDDFTDKTK